MRTTPIPPQRAPSTPSEGSVKQGQTGQASDTQTAPTQSHISNWERDLVTRRSAERAAHEASEKSTFVLTVGLAAIGAAALFLGQAYVGLPLIGAAVLLSPGDKPHNRNDPR